MFKVTLAAINKITRKQRVRVAQRLLNEYGIDAEKEVKLYFPEGLQKEYLLTELRVQKKVMEDRWWNRGIVKTLEHRRDFVNARIIPNKEKGSYHVV